MKQQAVSSRDSSIFNMKLEGIEQQTKKAEVTQGYYTSIRHAVVQKHATQRVSCLTAVPYPTT